MLSNTQCHYDFTFSITFDSEPICTSLTTGNIQQQFMSWMEVFSGLPMLAETSICKSSSFVLKMPVICKLGIQLLLVCNYAQGSDKNSEHKDQQLQKCRQSIYTSLKQLDLILGKDKQQYLLIIALCFYAIIQRTLQTITELEDQFTIFHIVFWELKGQLTNEQTMEELIRKYFNVDYFHKFMYWEKETLINKYLSNKKQIKHPIQPLTFRASIAKQGLNNNKSPTLYQSFKQIPLAKSKNYSKQNFCSNYPSQNGQNRDDQLSNSMLSKLRFNNFKKKQQYQPLKADRLDSSGNNKQFNCISFRKNLQKHEQLSPNWNSALNRNLSFRTHNAKYLNSQFGTRN